MNDPHENSSAINLTSLSPEIRKLINLDKFFTLSLDLMCIANMDGFFLYINPAFEQALGYSMEELKEQTFITFIHPDDVAKTLKEMESLSRGEISIFFENRYRKKDGGYLNFQWNARPDPENGLIYATARDITYLKEIQRNLSEEIKKAASANRIKSEFLATMSHEIRTPMNAIIGYSECILEGLEGPITEEQEDSISRISRAGRHLLSLINQVLDISKIEAGKMELFIERKDLVEAIHAAIDTTKSLAEEKGLAVNFETNVRNCPCLFDQSKVRQVLINIIGNAIKFTSEGHIDIKLSRNTSDSKNEAVIRIRDTGVGMNEETREKIFDSFTQAGGSTAQVYGGTGLGLTIALELMKMHEGQIAVESTEGEGSEFIVTLPIRDPETSAPVGDGAEAPVRDSILIIDDDSAVTEMGRQILEESGYAVEVENRGEMAMETIRRIRPAAIMLDVKMPNRNGIDILNELKRDTQLKHIPVIIITMYDNQEVAFNLGVTAYLEKPLTRKSILEKIDILDVPVQTRTVLIVDDNRDDRDLARKLLSNQAYTLEEVSSGKDAMAFLLNQAVDLCILDLTMPLMDGFDLLKWIRNQPQLKDLPVIILTSEILSETEFDALSEEADKVLTKAGIRREQIVGAVRESLKKS